MKVKLLLLCSLALTSCYTETTDNYKESEATVALLNEQSMEKSRQLTTAVVDVLEDEDEKDRTPHSELALTFAQQDQLIEGLPIEPIFTKENIDMYTSGDSGDIKKIEKLLSKIQEDISNLRQEKHDEEIILDARTKELVEKGMLYEEQHKKKVWQRVWSWAKGTLGIGGIIAVAVFFPFVIPIAAQLFTSLITVVIPSVGSALGVVGQKTFDNVVVGVQKARKNVAGHKKKTFTREEVLELLDSELDFHQLKKDKHIIRKRKEKLEI